MNSRKPGRPDESELMARSTLRHILWLAVRVVVSSAPVPVDPPEKPPVGRQPLREIHLKPVEFILVPEVPLLTSSIARPRDDQRRAVRTFDPDGRSLFHE